MCGASRSLENRAADSGRGRRLIGLADNGITRPCNGRAANGEPLKGGVRL
jgi:hypothetical protein